MAKAQPVRYLGVGEVARRSGLAVSAIHFYEQKGFIRSERSAGNQRRYTADVLRFLAVIKVAQRAGIALSEIREVLGQYQPGVRLTAADWRAISTHWRARLDERIRTLTRLRDELDACIGCGCLSLKDCPLRNPGDVLAGDGSGARILERS